MLLRIMRVHAICCYMLRWTWNFRDFTRHDAFIYCMKFLAGTLRSVSVNPSLLLLSYGVGVREGHISLRVSLGSQTLGSPCGLWTTSIPAGNWPVGIAFVDPMLSGSVVAFTPSRLFKAPPVHPVGTTAVEAPYPIEIWPAFTKQWETRLSLSVFFHEMGISHLSRLCFYFSSWVRANQRTLFPSIFRGVFGTSDGIWGGDTIVQRRYCAILVFPHYCNL